MAQRGSVMMAELTQNEGKEKQT